MLTLPSKIGGGIFQSAWFYGMRLRRTSSFISRDIMIELILDDDRLIRKINDNSLVYFYVFGVVVFFFLSPWTMQFTMKYREERMDLSLCRREGEAFVWHL